MPLRTMLVSRSSQDAVPDGEGRSSVWMKTVVVRVVSNSSPCICERNSAADKLAFDAKKWQRPAGSPVPRTRLREQSITACAILLPQGPDPNSFFVAGGNAHEFHRPQDEACRCDSM